MSAEQFDACYETFNEEIVSKKTSRKTGYHKYFPSNKSNSFVRNAITGVPYPFRVGSLECHQCLYKIIDTTGTCDSDGYVITSRKTPTNSNPNHLFYDSKEQCMNHLRISANDSLQDTFSSEE
jgi:hypothetical protein